MKNSRKPRKAATAVEPARLDETNTIQLQRAILRRRIAESPARRASRVRPADSGETRGGSG